MTNTAVLLDVDTPVTHNALGKGVVSAHSGEWFEVTFESKVKKWFEAGCEHIQIAEPESIATTPCDTPPKVEQVNQTQKPQPQVIERSKKRSFPAKQEPAFHSMESEERKISGWILENKRRLQKLGFPRKCQSKG